MTVRRLRPALATVLVGLGVVGCGSPPARPAPPAPAGIAQVQPSWSSCAAAGAPVVHEEPGVVIQLPRLGADFVPTAVVVCQYTVEQRADGGKDLMALEGRAGGADDVAAVTAAVRLPNERPPRAGVPCTQDHPGVSWFALVDGAGRWARPGVPIDSCGKIRIEVRTAVEELTLVRVSAQPIREIESAAAAAAGCVQQWADMVWVAGQHQAGPPPAVRDDPLATEAQLRVCVYRVPPSERGGGKPAGTFERGASLPTAHRIALAAALGSATAAPTCTTPANRFAVVRSPDGGGAVYVELDGCRRILVEPANGPPWLATADAALIALLDQP